MKYWFTADYHLGHENIIKYCNRPFKSLEHMNTEIIRRHNERIKPEDVVFHIGDFCFKNTSDKGEGIKICALDWEKQLNGKIIHIKGNHDKNNSTKSLIEFLIINYGHYRVQLIHNPEDINVKYNWHFIGHIHDHWKFRKIKRNLYAGDPEIIYLINVGVDVWNFYPHTFEEIIKKCHIWRKNEIT